VRSELATFFEVFPNATVWANLREGMGYDIVFLGQAGPLTINLDEVQRRLDRPDYAPVAQSLREVGVGSAFELFSTFLGQKSDLQAWMAGAAINHDQDLRLQYLAGWGINSSLEDFLYNRMLAMRQPPRNLFRGSPERLALLLSHMASESEGQ
jgi:spermidine synthase